MRPRYDALLSIGSNIDPARNVGRVLDWLSHRLEVSAISPIYQSAAVGGAPGQPEFLNLAVRIATDLSPRALREVARRAEDVCARVRSADRYAPRTMDVDLVWHEMGAADFGAWRLPDPQLASAPFVLVPSADVAPELIHPESGRTLKAMREDLAAASVDLLTQVALNLE